MRVSDWMSPDPVSIAPVVAVAEAARVMHAYGIRHLPVVRHERVVGVLSDRDVRSALPGRPVADVMSAPPHVIAPEEKIDAAARLMLSRHISALPVVDDHRHLVGMITTTDCLLASLALVETPAN